MGEKVVLLAMPYPHVSSPDELDRILCVDMDERLLKTDPLVESVLELIRIRPWECLRIPVWLVSGKACLRRQLAERVSLDVDRLAYDEDVVAFLRLQRIEGRRIVLATSGDERLARAVAAHLGFFDEVLCGDSATALKNGAKLEAIESRYGRGRVEYLGTGPPAPPIRDLSAPSLVVRPTARLVDPYLRLLRVHQWLKNVLLIVPLITAHRLGEWPLLFTAALAFVAFSAGASSIYIFNDLMDLPSDRMHPRKRTRPLASGTISIRVGLACGTGLLAVSIALACALPSLFLELLLLYLAICLSYTFWIKRKMLVDVICLAGLYTLRILAGGAATGIIISPWLLAFSMFLFLSLALVKRFAELLAQGEAGREKLDGRNYNLLDLDMIRSLGLASGCVSVLVIGLYLQDESVARLYRTPEALWFICPIVLYWIMRIWFLAQRGQLLDDPVVFALTDRNSQIAGILCGVVIVAGTF